jgi:hypothetical protein
MMRNIGDLVAEGTRVYLWFMSRPFNDHWPVIDPVFSFEDTPEAYK